MPVSVGVGLGYVGLPLAMRGGVAAGHQVTGYDTDPDQVKWLQARRVLDCRRVLAGPNIDTL